MADVIKFCAYILIVLGIIGSFVLGNELGYDFNFYAFFSGILSTALLAISMFGFSELLSTLDFINSSTYNTKDNTSQILEELKKINLNLQNQAGSPSVKFPKVVEKLPPQEKENNSITSVNNQKIKDELYEELSAFCKAEESTLYCLSSNFFSNTNVLVLCCGEKGVINIHSDSNFICSPDAEGIISYIYEYQKDTSTNLIVTGIKKGTCLLKFTNDGSSDYFYVLVAVI